MKELYSLRDVDLVYPGKSHIFRGLNFSLKRGDFILVRGASGSGKTSFLRLLNRLSEPGGGEIRFNGELLTSQDPVLLRQRAAYIQQIPVMLEGTVEENLLFPFRFRVNRMKPVPSVERIRGQLDTFLLSGIDLGDNAQRLSVGEQQRIALIRSMFLEPDVYLLDEPVSALDEESRKLVEKFLEHENKNRGVTVILVSHIGHTFRGVNPGIYRIADSRLVREDS